MVIELDDEVEYLVPVSAVSSIINGQNEVIIIRLFDRKNIKVSVNKIKSSLGKKGVIDYLKKPK